MDLASRGLAAVFAISILFGLIRVILNYRRKLVLLEAQVAFLFEKLGMSFEPVVVVTPKIREAVADGQEIEAIRLYRDVTGSSLKEAKDAVAKLTL